MEANLPFPVLADEQYALLMAEAATGIVLCTNGHRYIGTGEVYAVYNGQQASYLIAEALIQQHPHIECVVYNAQQEVVYILPSRS